MNFKLFSGGTFVYLGIGFLVHLIFIGTTIAWNSAFSLFLILGWPFYLFYLALWVIMWIAIACVVGFLIFCAYCYIKDRT